MKQHGHLSARTKKRVRLKNRDADGEEKPSKKSKKESIQGAVAILKEKKRSKVVQLKKSDPKKSTPRTTGQTRLNASAGHAAKFSGRTWHEIQIRERKGPSRGVIQKGEPHERRPSLRKEHLRKPQDKKNVPAMQQGKNNQAHG